jgi:hypothetical protein
VTQREISDTPREEFRAVAHFHEPGVSPHDCLPVASREQAERDAAFFKEMEGRGRIKLVSHVVIERRVITDWTPCDEIR